MYKADNSVYSCKIWYENGNKKSNHLSTLNLHCIVGAGLLPSYPYNWRGFVGTQRSRAL
jgi:hypothetical protein